MVLEIDSRLEKIEAPRGTKPLCTHEVRQYLKRITKTAASATVVGEKLNRFSAVSVYIAKESPFEFVVVRLPNLRVYRSCLQKQRAAPHRKRAFL